MPDPLDRRTPANDPCRHAGRRLPAALVLLLVLPAPGLTAERMRGGVVLGLEGGSLAFVRNDARIPGDSGTEFDVTTLTGTDGGAFARVSGQWHLGERHSLRLVYAPLEVTETGALEQDTAFSGETFATGPAEGTYQFNAWKLTYRYTFPSDGRWHWGVGFTGLVRDARIELRQGATNARDENVGFVPALHLWSEYRLSDRWALELDFDGLAGGPGRLFDVALKLEHDLGANWRIGAGYRVLEGGADTDEVFNFAQLNYALLDLRYHFR